MSEMSFRLGFTKTYSGTSDLLTRRHGPTRLRERKEKSDGRNEEGPCENLSERSTVSPRAFQSLMAGFH